MKSSTSLFIDSISLHPTTRDAMSFTQRCVKGGFVFMIASLFSYRTYCRMKRRRENIGFMRKACALALLSTPVDSAYCVGAVIVKDGDIISSGYSREIEGNTHAEQCALMKLDQIDYAEGATIFTTMEPCSKRLSKNTPCVTRCIEARIGRVVIGAREPSNFVVCEGVSLLEKAGIEVEFVPELEEECLLPNVHLFHNKT